jgi:TP901 family phage tail tape measure protein
MSSNLAIGVTIGAVLGATYDRAFNGATSRVNQLGDAMRSFKSQRGLTEAFDRDEAAVGKARIALEKVQREVMAVKKALKKDPNNRALAKDLEKTEKTAAELSAKLNSARVAATRSGQAMRQAGLDAAKSAQEHVRLGAAIDKVEREQKQLDAVLSRRNQAGARIGQLRTQLLGLTGVAFAAGKAIGQALDVERATVRLSTVVNAGDVDAAVKASRRSAIEFARANLTSEGDVLNIEYALNSAGFEASFARSTSGLVAKVAKVTDGTAEQVGEVMATVFNNLGSSLQGTQEEQITRIGELLTKTQFKFQIRDFGQLGESFKAASPTLARFNVELDQGATLIGALNSAGLQGGAAGTALSASFRGLGKASKEMGFQIAKNAEGGTDFTTTLENLSQSIGGFESLSDDTNAALQKAFGDEGVKGVVLLGKQLDKLRAAQKDVTEGSKGLVDKSYQRFLDSASGKTEIFQNNVRLLGTAFGAGLVPILNTVLPPLVSITIAVGRLLDDFPVVATGIGVVVGAAALWTVGVLAANAATWLWNSAILGLKFGTAFARLRVLTVATWAYARGALPGAISAASRLGSVLGGALTRGLAVARAGTLRLIATMRTAAVTSFTAMRTGAIRLGTALGGALTRGLAMAGRGVAILGRALLLNPIGLAVTVIAGAAFLIWKNWSKIGPALKAFWGGIKNAASKAWGGIKAVAGTVFDASKKAFSFTPLGLVVRNWGSIKGFFGNLGERLKPAFNAIWTASKKAFSFTPLGFVIKNWGAIMDFFKALPSKFGAIGGQIIDGLLGGITAGWDRLKAGVTNIGDGIANQFKSVLGIKSPSRVFMGLGDMLGLGLQQGMLGTARLVAGAALALATAATPDIPGSAGPGVGVGARGAGAAAAVVAAAGGAPATTSAPTSATMQITIGPIQITQQAGEDAEALAERVAAAIERKAGRIRRAALGDLA